MLRFNFLPRRRRQRKWANAGLSVAALLGTQVFCHAAAAQEWKLDTSISQRFLYSDNLLLGRDNEINTAGSVTTPTLRLTRNSPTLNVSLDGAFDFSEYFSASDFNSQDQRLRLNATKILSERSSLSLGGGFINDTLLKTELNESGRFVNHPIGLIAWDVRPSWSYLLSPVDQFTLSGSYRSNTYDSNDKVDYTYYGATTQYGHKLSDIDQLTATASYFRYVPDGSRDSGDDVATNTFSALLGYGYEPSERLSLSGAAGLGYSIRESSSGSGQNNDNSDDTGLGYRLKFNARYDISEVTSVRFDLSHDSEPGNDGDQTTRNRLTLGFDQALTPLTKFSLNMQYVDTFDYLGLNNDPSSDGNETRFIAVRPSLSWRLTEDVSLNAEYNFRYKLYEQGDDAAMANAVYLTLRYQLPTWAWDGY